MKDEETRPTVTVREVLKGENGTGPLRNALLAGGLLLALLSFLGGFVVDRIGMAETESGNRAHIVQMDNRLKNIEQNMATRRELDLLRGQVAEMQRTLNELLLPDGWPTAGR